MKKGITISMLAVTIVLMTVIAGIVGVVGTSSIKTAAYEEFLSKINRVSNEVNRYVIQNKTLPTTNEIISKQGLDEDLKAKITENNDINNNLFVIDTTKLKLESVNIGKGTVGDLDVFIVAENTNNVYYLKGIMYKGEKHFGM